MEKLDKTRWARLSALLDGALESPPGLRAAYLDDACRDAPDLRRHVEELLKAGERAPKFLSGQALDFALPVLCDVLQDEEAETLMANRRVGPYRLIAEIDRGGMGVVYSAERIEGAFKRRVAVKLLPPSLGTATLLRRFENEQRALAPLNHPHIARLYDGGVTEQGQPYFVMELVDGLPIDRYCDTHRLTLDARLRLFQEAAGAVQYAHRNLVVHRDLKPSNILVCEPESGAPEEGHVKLLDFGVAKLLSDGGASGDALTRTGERWMTPEYAAPEQVTGEPVTTATDVYQLGVVLYELLTGRRPHAAKGGSPYHLEVAIAEQEPKRPSVLVREKPRSGGAENAAQDSPEAIGQARRLRIDQLGRRLAGDLDAIVMKALRKKPEERYATPEAMVEDLRRYQSGQPVEARRGNAAYRAGKFMRRHRWGVTTAALFVVLLIAYAVTVTLQADRIQSALTEVRLERDKAEWVSNFLVNLFRTSDPAQTQGETVTARQLLEWGARQIETTGGQPAVQAEMMHVMGRAFEGLGHSDRALPLLQGAVDTYRGLHGPPRPELAGSLTDLAATLRSLDDYEAARGHFDEALRIWERFPAQATRKAKTLWELGLLSRREGKYRDAEELYRQALALMRGRHPGDHPDIAAVLSSLAVVLRREARYAEAEPVQRAALEMRQRLFGNGHAEVAQSQNNLATLLVDLERYEEAEGLFRKALATREKIYGPEHPLVAVVLHELGRLLHSAGKLQEAERRYRLALAIRRKRFGDEPTSVRASLFLLGALLQDRGDYDAAHSAFGKMLEIDRKIYADNPLETGRGLMMAAGLNYDRKALRESRRDYEKAVSLLEDAGSPLLLSGALVGYGRLRTRQGHAGEAEPLLRRALLIRRRELPKGHRWTAEAEVVLGVCLISLGRRLEAASLLQTGHAVLQQKRGSKHRHTQEALQGLLQLAEVENDQERVEHYRKLLEQANAP